MIDCIFCKIISKELPAQSIAENKDIIVVKDIAPKATIHYLIIPKSHIKDFSSLKETDHSLWVKMAEMAHYIASQDPQAQEFRLIVNNGYNAGQRVFHLHMHFLAGKLLPEF